MKFFPIATALFVVAAVLPLAAQEGAPGVDLLDPASVLQTAPEQYTVEVETSAGNFEIQVTRSWAPNAADRFYSLVQAGFYEESRFFRVVRDFVAQFGLPADPVVGQLWAQEYIPDDRRRRPNRSGMVSMATPGRNRRTTQVFVNLANNSELDQQGFAPFGQVTEGMRTVLALNSMFRDAPNQPMILAEGNAYLNDRFSSLDYIIKATVIDEK